MLLGRALICDRILLLRQRDSSDVGASEFRQVQAKPAPAAADVQNALPSGQPQLCSKMTLFCELRVVERCVWRLEIAAAVLSVGIQKERIEATVEVIVMRDIAAGSPATIKLSEAPTDVPQQPLWP